MRYDPEHKERTRTQVLKEAAKAIRAEGPHKVGVAEIMAKAGLTHGGFYAHFKSKDELVAEAIRQMFVESGENFARLTVDRPPLAALENYIDFYLSPAHRDSAERGCPLPRLSADLPRLTAASRKNFAAGIEQLTGGVAALLKAGGCDEADTLAASILSELVGALSLARAIGGRAQSDALLEASRCSLKRRLAAAFRT
jgi:TetR/AcrR family transcriptional repressor of nem operon